MGPDLVPTVKWKSALAMKKMYEKPKQMLHFIIYKNILCSLIFISKFVVYSYVLTEINI